MLLNIKNMAFNVKIEEDKFKGKKVYKGPTIGLDRGGNIFTTSSLLRPQIAIRKVELPDYNALVIDFTAESKYGEMCLSQGSIIFAIDGKTIELEAHENWNDSSELVTASRNSATNTTTITSVDFHTESVYYEIDETILKAIADAHSFGMKVYAGNCESEITNPEKFQGYARAFYNKVYDKNAYIEEAESFKPTNNNGTMGQVKLGLIIVAVIFLFFGILMAAII